MAGDVDDVVDTAEKPEVAVFVALRAVAGEVDARPLRPVLLHVPVGILPDAAQHRRPRRSDGEISAADRHTVAALVEDLRVDAGERPRRRTRLRGYDARQRRDENRPRLGL